MIGAGVAAAVGLYLVFKYYKNKSAEQNPQGNDTQGGQLEGGNKVEGFPIKNGDRDNGAPLNPKGKVVELQKLINTIGYKPKTGDTSVRIKLVADGLFGAKTEWAIEQYIGKKSIDNEQDLESLKAKLIQAKG